MTVIELPKGVVIYYSGGVQLGQELQRLLPRPPLPLSQYSETDSLVILEWQATAEQIAWVQANPRARALVCLPDGLELPLALQDNPRAALFLFPFDISEIRRVLGLAQPLDPDEVAARVWQRNRHLVDQSLEAIARNDSFLSRVHAHRLAGSLGSFGLPQGSEVAKSIELAILEGHPEQVPGLLASLRRIIETGPLSPEGDDHKGQMALLLLLREPDRHANLLKACADLDLRLLVASNLQEAQRMMLDSAPEISLVEHSHPDFSGWLAQLRQNHQDHAAILALSGPEAVDLPAGFRSWVQPGLENLLAEIERQMEWRRAQKFQVLVIDDDPMTLTALRRLLSSRRIHVTAVQDAVQFWVERHRYQPDLVILDVEMPRLSGYELCRGLRADPQFQDRAILILTAHGDPETVARLFRAGADDFVTKPFVGPELISRVESRLERFRLLRALIETDPLTGLVNRRKALQSLERYLLLARRQQRPLTLAVIDVDLFKSINDRYGHLQGDQVLLHLGGLLKDWFRGEDVICRWGGEEFLVGMYGMEEGDAVVRLGLLLEKLRQHGLGPEPVIALTFSAGIASLPGDSQDLKMCVQMADERLYQAKREGRQRVRGRTRHFQLRSADPDYLRHWSEALARFSWSVSEQGPILQDPNDPAPVAGALGLGRHDPLERALALLRSRP